MRVIKAAIFFLFASGADAIGQTSFWNNAASPNSQDIASDTSSVTLGLRFYTDVPGSITGVRFFKGSNNTGQHVGTLWSGTGTKLAEVTFSGETASGWQQASFPTPVSISANTPYIISYFAPNGNYADDEAYSWSALNAPPLHPSGSSPGVYAYSIGASFPNGVYNASNYWVDPIFAASAPQQPAPSGSSSFWTTSTAPATADVTNDGASVTLGLQFYSDIPGSITGVRFYKGTNNSGPHIGTLWSSTGSKLAEVTFSGETATGWQQANFTSPVTILANTHYVVSYLAPKGNYAVNQPYSWSALSAVPLHVGSSSPGVYTYGSGTNFPQGTYNGSNYWVDPVFTPGNPSSTYSISGTVTTGSGATVSLSGAATATVTADASGNYSFPSLANGSYVITPAKTGFTFTPPSAPATVKGANVTSINFTATATTRSISGTITGVSGATVSLSGAATAATTADGSGNYSFPGLANGSYVITPAKTGFTFTPPSAPATVNGASVTSINFTATANTWSISGTVTGSGATLTVSGASSRSGTTDSAGRYSFSGLANGSYVVAASQTGFVFTPTTVSLAINGASVAAVNFSAKPAPHSVTLSWTSSTSPNVDGYNVYRATVSAGPYAKLTPSPITSTSYIDSAVASGQTYFYVSTAVNTSNQESGYSNIANATIPVP